MFKALLISVIFNAFATPCDPILSKVFQAVYRLAEYYDRERCARNTYLFLKEVKKAGGDLTQHKVVFIDRETRIFQPVPVEKPIRGGDIPLLPSHLSHHDFWRYHFFVMDGANNVFDPEISKEPLPLATYLDRVFPQKGVETPQYMKMDRLNHLYLSVIPANEYVPEYDRVNDENGLAKAYRNELKAKYPIIRARDYLKTLQK